MFDQPFLERMDVWITPVFISSFDQHNELKKQLIQCVYDNQNNALEQVASGVASSAKQALYESPFDFLEHNASAVQTLKIYLENLILLAAQEANQAHWPEDIRVTAHITESWCHITKNGGYHDAHTHPNCSWCGIYYLDIGNSDLFNRNGINRFYDPRVNAEHYMDAGSNYLHEEGIMDIDPQDGQIVIFPSYLRHSALPYFGELDRLVIAFNAQVHYCDANPQR